MLSPTLFLIIIGGETQMAEKNNATCSICGSGYHVCHSCKDSIQLQPWKIHCCSVDCFKTYQVVRGFSTGVYTKDEFKSKLQNINLSNLENYREHIKALIKDALKEKPVAKAVEKIESIEAIIETDVAEVKEEIVVENVAKVEEPKNITKTTYTRKRNYKTETE